MVKSLRYKLVWDKNALDNLIGILTYLEKQSDQAPKIVKKAILERLNLIKRSPLVCEVDRLKDNPNKDFRAFIVFSYRVTYQISSTKSEIRVLRIMHTSREPLGY